MADGGGGGLSSPGSGPAPELGSCPVSGRGERASWEAALHQCQMAVLCSFQAVALCICQAATLRTSWAAALCTSWAAAPRTCWAAAP